MARTKSQQLPKKTLYSEVLKGRNAIEVNEKVHHLIRLAPSFLGFVA